MMYPYLLQKPDSIAATATARTGPATAVTSTAAAATAATAMLLLLQLLQTGRSCPRHLWQLPVLKTFVLWCC
jgi:hypothetical protein